LAFRVWDACGSPGPSINSGQAVDPYLPMFGKTAVSRSKFTHYFMDVYDFCSTRRDPLPRVRFRFINQPGDRS
jgi:hypothetical protein